MQNSLFKKIEALQAEINDLKENHGDQILRINQRFSEYILLTDYNLFKDQITSGFEEIIQKLVKKFADTALVKKWIANLERDIKKLFELIEDMSLQNETAMLSKKPLGGISCASCEKNLVNLQCFPPAYLTWGKFPKSENKPMSKGGFGISKILSMMKPEDIEKAESFRLYCAEMEEGQNTESPDTKLKRPISTFRTGKLPFVRKSNK